MSEETAEQSQKVVLHMGCGPVRVSRGKNFDLWAIGHKTASKSA